MHPTEALDYAAILRGMVRRHKRLMIGIFLGLAVPLMAMLIYTSRSFYASTATISIEASPPDLASFASREAPRKENLAALVALLKSRSLSEGVVEALPRESFEELLSHAQYTDYFLTLTNVIKRWTGHSPTVLSPQQRAVAEIQNARIEFVQSLEAPGIFSIRATASGPRVAMDLVNTYIQVLLSRTRNANQEDVRKIREFIESQLQQAKNNLAQAEEGLTKFQQQRGRIKLGTQTELDLIKYSQAESSLAEAQASYDVLVARITALRQSVNQERAKPVKGSPEGQANEKGEAGGVARSAESLARLNEFKVAQDNLTRLEAKLASLSERYTEGHPLVQSTQEEVGKQQARVAQLARNLPAPSPSNESRAPQSAGPSDRTEAQRQLAQMEMEEGTLQSKVESLKIQVERLRKSLRNLSQDELSYSSLSRTVEANRNLMSILSDKLMAARMREQGESSVIRIIDPASFPLQSTQSKAQNLALMLLALAGASALGVAFGLELWRQPLETDSDVLKATGLPVLGSVGVMGTPIVRAKGRARKQPRALPVHLPDSSGQSSIHMELYRAMRATVETERLKTPFRSILVTSPNPHEGKSTTILNLANVFQQFGRRVLVVDADLRRPSIHRALSLTNKPGIMDFLEGTATFEQVCRTLPSGVTVIPGQVAGDDAASMLVSPRAKELFDLACRQFDLVLVDSAPLLAVPDNLLLLTMLERVILVIKASATSKRDLRRAQATAEKANAQILGVVLNQSKSQDVHYYHPKYRKYYKTEDAKATPGASARADRSPTAGKK